MNDQTRMLIRFVCDGDIKKAQAQACVVLKNEKTKKDERFCADMLHKLEAKRGLIELPYNLKELLIAEAPENYPSGKFSLRQDDAQIVDEIIRLYSAADKLASMGIPYLPAAIFYGESGCGKTELARYVSYKTNLPFVYVQFSNVVGSHLGSTQTNIGKIFEYARTSPCILCFDEIDAVGMCRGQVNDVGEMNRIVIALMQELDMMPNNVIIIGTTNRFDRLDPALVRRFPIQHEVRLLTPNEAVTLARSFFQYAGVESDISDSWFDHLTEGPIPASTVVKDCTDAVVSLVMEQQSPWKPLWR